MYLSHLLIDIGNDPDKPRPGRLWLRDLYRVHQRLCMAFPSASRKKNDPDFLKPYDPKDFRSGEVQQPQHVHNKRQTDAGFLFRIDPMGAGRVVILVQSAEPDWDYAFHNAKHFLAAPPEWKIFDPQQFKAGQQFQFRLVANPTRRFSKHSTKKDGQPIDEKDIGKRVPVPADQLKDWLGNWTRILNGKKEPTGFSINNDSISVHSGYAYTKLDDKGQRLFSARYEGILEVTDSDAFQKTLIGGIGPAKAFGFGLLSVMPVKSSAPETT